VLGGVAVLVLGQVVLRILRRAAPGPMPSRLAPVLTTPLRARLFGGTPERVLARAGVTPGMRVLEVGPGPGVYTIPLARWVASSSEDGGVTCLEIQPEMITMLRERLRVAGERNVEIVQGDGRKMPLPSGSFDLVFLVDVVGEVPDKSVFFRECAGAQTGRYPSGDRANQRPGLPFAEHRSKTRDRRWIEGGGHGGATLVDLHRTLPQIDGSSKASQV
jgi:hypothetical protein